MSRNYRLSQIIQAAGPNNPYIPKYITPPPPARDPWEIMLKPELEADTERCNAWKDEVQNLLIFAGLFSAVVTAFVIESYKFLQPDPNDAVIGLLFFIANSPSLNNSSPFPPSVDQSSITSPFSQTSSSVRINIFWFLSLVLSLTTVLIGTISLQWLREHQSYAGFSAKEKLAILHMRSAALEIWCVPQIFAALPVLLQAALTLFLAGLIDFVLPLGHKLTISISVIVGLTLFFLAVTTVLPTCQSFFFLIGFYPYNHPPSPCAFKSPQSHVILTICSPLLRLLSYIISRTHQTLFNSPTLFRRYDLLVYLRKALQQKTWSAWDRKWLDLRDGYHQCIHDKDPGIYQHRQKWAKEFPLSDLTQILIKAIQETSSAKHTAKDFPEAATRCFEELSKSIWTKQSTDYGSNQRKDRRNSYFEQLISPSNCSLSNWLIHDGVYRFDRVNAFGIRSYIGDHRALLFHQDQMVYFLGVLLSTHSSPNLAQFQVELWTQIMQYSHVPPLQSSNDSESSSSTPIILIRRSWYYPIESIGQRTADQKHSSVVDMLNVVFQSAALHRISQDPSIRALCTHSEMALLLFRMASWADDYLEWANQIGNISDQQQRRDIDTRYTSTLKFVAEHLDNEMSNSDSNNKEDTPSVIFYLATIFMQQLLDWSQARTVLQNADSGLSQGLRSLLEVLLHYKTWTSGRKNDVLEARFKQDSDYRFSDEFWDTLFEHGRKIGLEDSAEESISTEGSSSDSHPNSSLGEFPPQNTTDIQISRPPSPSAASEAYNSFNTPITDIAHVGPARLADVDLHPALLTNPSNAINREGDKIGQPLSDSPAIVHGDNAINAQYGRDNDSPQLSSYSTLIPQQKLSPLHTTRSTSTPRSLRQVESSSANDTHRIQTDEHHVAIDFGSPGVRDVVQGAGSGSGPSQIGDHTMMGDGGYVR